MADTNTKNAGRKKLYKFVRNTVQNKFLNIFWSTAISAAP